MVNFAEKGGKTAGKSGMDADHATFGSGPTRQSDDRASEPDYLLCPTRHGQGRFTIQAKVFFI